MFRIASAVAEENGTDINELAEIKGKIPKHLRKLMNRIKSESNWRGTLVELKARIKKIIRTQNFTERDIRKLKKLLKQQMKNGDIDIDFILEQFPGKTARHILDFRRDYLGF